MPAIAMTWAVAVPLVGLILYRRVRRNFGRQPLRVGRLMLRSGLLALVAAILLVVGLVGAGAASTAGLGVLAGLAAGGVLAVVGLRMTRFEHGASGHWYTPNPMIGVALTALLLGRLAYRFFAVRALSATATAADPSSLEALQRSPLTLALAALLIGYYLVYCIGLLRAARRDDVNAVGAKPD